MFQIQTKSLRKGVEDFELISAGIRQRRDTFCGIQVE